MIIIYSSAEPLSMESIIGLAIGIPAIILLIILITLVAILLSLLFVKSRKKGAYTTDPVSSSNPAYGLTKKNTSSGNAVYDTVT